MNFKKKLSASLEDYLEAIFNIVAERDIARSRDIAEYLNVSRASVTAAVKLLSEKGLAVYKPYSFVKLTEKGQKEAQAVVNRHSIIESFFSEILGIDKSTASKAACRAEHTLGPTVMSKLADFNEFVMELNTAGRIDICAKFRHFTRKSTTGGDNDK